MLLLPGYQPVPIGSLLQRLQGAGIAVTISRYEQSAHLLAAHFPLGLLLDPDGKINAGEYQAFLYMLSALLVKSAEDRELFDSVMEAFEEWDKPFVPPLETGKNDPPATKGNTQEKRKRRKLIFRRFAGTALLFLICNLVFLGVFRSRLADFASRKKLQLSYWQVPGTDSVNFMVSGKAFAGSVWHWQLDGRAPVTKTLKDTIWKECVDLGLHRVSVTSEGRPDYLLDSFAGRPFGVDTAVLDMRITALPPVQPAKPSVLLDFYFPDVHPLLTAPLTRPAYWIGWGRETALAIALMVVAALFWLFYYPREKRQRSSGAPLFFRIGRPDPIIADREMSQWPKKFNFREDTGVLCFDVAASITGFIRSGGLPVLYEKRSRVRVKLLLFIDTIADTQQTDVYRFMHQYLERQDVDISAFFFREDPGTCWNRQFTDGIALTEIARLMPQHKVILFTAGENWVDYNSGQVFERIRNYFENWETKALLTIRPAGSWNIREKALSATFLLLPATVEAFSSLSAYFQLPFTAEPEFPAATNGKNFERLRLEELSNSQVWGHLAAFTADHREQRLLYQWACATALYPYPDLAVTLRTGKVIGRRAGLELNTAANLLIITGLPWLQTGHIPAPLRRRLIRELDDDVAEELIAGLQDLLYRESGAKYGSSAAEEERKVRLLELEVQSRNWLRRNKALRHLAGYTATGLIKDRLTRRMLRVQRMRIGFSAAAAGLLAAAAVFFGMQKIGPQNSGLVRVQRPDSAAFYNNKAVRLSDGVTQWYDLGVYSYIAERLDSALLFRHVPAVVYLNLNIMKYDRGVYEYLTGAAGDTLKIFGAEERRDLNALTQPFKILNDLGRQHIPLIIYLKYLQALSARSGADVIQKQLLADYKDLNKGLIPDKQQLQALALAIQRARAVFNAYRIRPYWGPSLEKGLPTLIDAPTQNFNMAQRDSLILSQAYLLELFHSRSSKDTTQVRQPGGSGRTVTAPGTQGTIQGNDIASGTGQPTNGSGTTVPGSGSRIISAANNSNLAAMGNISDATTDVRDSLNYLMDQTYFVESYNAREGKPNWVSWRLVSSDLDRVVGRQNTFFQDKNLPPQFHKVTNAAYSKSGYDRGHNCPVSDRSYSAEAMASVYLLTNIMPQTQQTNAGSWYKLEKECDQMAAKGDTVYIVCGSFGKGAVIGGGAVTAPAYIWKVVLDIPKGSTLSRTGTGARLITVLIPNNNQDRGNWINYVVPLSTIERQANVHFFQGMAADVQRTLRGLPSN